MWLGGVLGDNDRAPSFKETFMSERVEFKPPRGWNPPEQTDPGKDFDLVCSFRVKPSGQLCLVKLGDHDMPGYGDKSEEAHENKPDYSEYAKGMAESMDQATNQ